MFVKCFFEKFLKKLQKLEEKRQKTPHLVVFWGTTTRCGIPPYQSNTEHYQKVMYCITFIFLTPSFPPSFQFVTWGKLPHPTQG